MKYRFAIQDGKRVAVLRPDDVARAILLEREANAKETPEERAAAHEAAFRSQSYSVVGWYAAGEKRPNGKGRRILNDDGWSVGQCKRGDQLVPEADIERAAATLDERPEESGDRDRWETT